MHNNIIYKTIQRNNLICVFIMAMVYVFMCCAFTLDIIFNLLWISKPEQEAKTQGAQLLLNYLHNIIIFHVYLL